MIVFRNYGSSDMDLVLLPDMPLWIIALSDTISSIMTYIRVMYHIECDMEGLKCLPYATYESEYITCP